MFCHSVAEYHAAIELYQTSNNPTLIENALDASEQWARRAEYGYAITLLEEEDSYDEIVSMRLKWKRLTRSIVMGIPQLVAERTHRQRFRNRITQELIAEAMHPRRMMARISQFDDIETFFDAC
jgi:hypothetical protein